MRNKGDSDLYVKTTISALNEDENVDLQITGFSRFGFIINKNMSVLGPIVIFPKLIYSWNIEDENDINHKTLSLFPMLEPKLGN